MKPKVRELIREAEAAGWVLIRQKKHFVLRHPRRGLCSVPKSASDHRSLINTRKDMGLDD